VAWEWHSDPWLGGGTVSRGLGVAQRAVAWGWHIELWLGGGTSSCGLGVAQRAVAWGWHSELWLGGGTSSCGLGVAQRAVAWEWHIELWLGVAPRAVAWEWHSELWLGSGTVAFRNNTSNPVFSNHTHGTDITLLQHYQVPRTPEESRKKKESIPFIFNDESTGSCICLRRHIYMSHVK
jgi:hypothetical protein